MTESSRVGKPYDRLGGQRSALAGLPATPEREREEACVTVMFQRQLTNLYLTAQSGCHLCEQVSAKQGRGIDGVR